MQTSEIKILVVDDEPDIIEIIEYNLSKEGFIVYTATNGLEAIDTAIKTKPHLILLDIMMPMLDGVETCHRLRDKREFDQTLIAFLTARNEEYSQIAGFEAGADDYIQKPIRPRLLITRLKALLRRHNDNLISSTPNQILFGGLKIDKEKYELFYEDNKLDLAKKEFDILWLLASKPGKVFSREEIYRKVWEADVIVGNRTIDVHISKLREKLGQDYIKTIKGIGYKLDN
jgi:two-component system, OmpR family, alkaline phosphatase synthesis response regulator PhoP